MSGVPTDVTGRQGVETVTSPVTTDTGLVSEYTLVTEAQAADPTPGEAQTTPAAKPPDDREWVPRSRLNEVIAQRQQARDSLEQIKASEAKRVEDAKREANANEQPPEGMSEDEAVAWTVKKHSRNYIEGELGMSLADAKTLLSTSQATSKDYAQRQWESECNTRGIDPTNQEAMEMIAGLVKTAGVSTSVAFERAKKFYGRQEATPPVTALAAEPTATVESVSQTGVMTAHRGHANNAREATEMAMKGIRAEHRSSQDIVREAMAAEAQGNKPILRTI
jgi:hypothetical protein